MMFAGYAGDEKNDARVLPYEMAEYWPWWISVLNAFEVWHGLCNRALSLGGHSGCSIAPHADNGVLMSGYEEHVLRRVRFVLCSVLVALVWFTLGTLGTGLRLWYWAPVP
jgi:hypothetical protein